MNIQLTVPLALAAAFIRWTLHVNGTVTDGFNFAPIHLLFMLAAVFIAGWQLLKTDPAAEVPALFKTGFRAAMIYAVIAALFAYALYSWIDPTFFPIKMNALVDQAIKEGHTEAEAREKVGAFFSPFNYATITLAAFMIIGAIDAMVCALLHHKFLRKVG
jgi:hypothetical protein